MAKCRRQRSALGLFFCGKTKKTDDVCLRKKIGKKKMLCYVVGTVNASIGSWFFPLLVSYYRLFQ